MKWFVTVIAAALLIGSGHPGFAQTATLRDQLLGSWSFVLAEITAADGKTSHPFGESPRGVLIFTPDGRFAQIHISGDAPKIVSGNRLNGTSEEYAAIMRGSLSVFGTYAVDEEKRTVTYSIEGSSFPNWAGEKQTRTIEKLTAEEFVNTNPSVGGGRGSARNLYRRSK
jgi:Lipocalin-like domain